MCSQLRSKCLSQPSNAHYPAPQMRPKCACTCVAQAKNEQTTKLVQSKRKTKTTKFVQPKRKRAVQISYMSVILLTYIRPLPDSLWCNRNPDDFAPSFPEMPFLLHSISLLPQQHVFAKLPSKHLLHPIATTTGLSLPAEAADFLSILHRKILRTRKTPKTPRNTFLQQDKLDSPPGTKIGPSRHWLFYFCCPPQVNKPTVKPPHPTPHLVATRLRVCNNPR